MSDSAVITPSPDPLALFTLWFAEAAEHEPADPNAMTLATVGADGFPSARVMLMKGYDAKGFTFYTNRQSRKGEQLDGAGKAALCFFWKSLYRQVRIEGTVVRVDDEESEVYFGTRPRGSQIGAWASMQSAPLEGRASLMARVRAFEDEFKDRPVPRPPHWGGYRVEPRMIEFWQGHEFRLHDRVVYRRDDLVAPWTWERVYP